MHTLLLSILVALPACATHFDAVTPDAGPAPVAPVPAPSPAKARTILDGMEPGPIAGTTSGFSLAYHQNAHFCMGREPVITNTQKAVTIEEAPLVDVLALDYPRGLDFSAAHRDASMKRFQTFVNAITTRGQKARERYADTLQDSADVRDKLAAAARIVQIQHYLGTLLLHAEIPVDVRGGEFAEDKQDAFCDKLAEVAEPLFAAATEAAAACAEHASSAPVGFWNQVCLAPRRSL